MIGNPLTADWMIRYVLTSGLCAPCARYSDWDSNGRAVFEYDLPSALFGQFGNEATTGSAFKASSSIQSRSEWSL